MRRAGRRQWWLCDLTPTVAFGVAGSGGADLKRARLRSSCTWSEVLVR